MTTPLLTGCPRCRGTLRPSRLDPGDLTCVQCGHVQYGLTPEAPQPEHLTAGGYHAWVVAEMRARRSNNIKECVRLYDAGRRSKRQVAALMGVHRGTVNEWLKEARG